MQWRKPYKRLIMGQTLPIILGSNPKEPNASPDFHHSCKQRNGKIEEKLDAAPPAVKQTTRAPKPINPVASRAAMHQLMTLLITLS